MRQLLQEILPEIIKIRHQIHANPELAHEEKRTASLVANTLRNFGYPVTENIAGTGVTTILDSNKPGKTDALRADMDALPITETTDLLYKTLVKQQISDIASGISRTYGATGVTTFSNSFPPTINHPHETDIVVATAKQVLDIEHVETLLQPIMGSEDFSCYLEKIPGCFFWIGMGLENLSIHNSNYEFNDAIIPIAAEILAKTAINYLNQNYE